MPSIGSISSIASAAAARRTMDTSSATCIMMPTMLLPEPDHIGTAAGSGGGASVIGRPPCTTDSALMANAVTWSTTWQKPGASSSIGPKKPGPACPAAAIESTRTSIPASVVRVNRRAAGAASATVVGGGSPVAVGSLAASSSLSRHAR